MNWVYDSQKKKHALCNGKMTSQRPLKPAAKIATIEVNAPARLWVSHYNKTATPRIPITAATTATPAGFSAPLLTLTVAEGGVTDFVGDPIAVVIGAIADETGIVPFPDACDVVIFAEPITKPELGVALAVTLGADVSATVVLEEVAVGAA